MESKELREAREELARLERQIAKARHFYEKGLISEEEVREAYRAHGHQRLKVNELENPNPDIEYWKKKLRNLGE